MFYFKNIQWTIRLPRIFWQDLGKTDFHWFYQEFIAKIFAKNLIAKSCRDSFQDLAKILGFVAFLLKGMICWSNIHNLVLSSVERRKFYECASDNCQVRHHHVAARSLSPTTSNCTTNASFRILLKSVPGVWCRIGSGWLVPTRVSVCSILILITCLRERERG